tara:strand:+ start:4218 stop:4382 length:165 start_codon:yes stop_codon:yes gene_type:complete
MKNHKPLYWPFIGHFDHPLAQMSVIHHQITAQIAIQMMRIVCSCIVCNPATLFK